MQALLRHAETSTTLLLPSPAVRFVAEEIGWLAEEAIAAFRRTEAQSDGGRTIRGLHRVDPFARLARHQRIVGTVQRALGHDVTIADSLLVLAGSLPSNPVHGVRAVVDLGSSPLLRAIGASGTSGLLTFQTGAADRGDYGLGRLLFMIDYAAADDATTAIAPERDDCLWPTPFACAG